MLNLLARIFLLRRLFGRGHHQPRYGARSGSGPGRRAHRRRGGFGMFGPVPTYSTRTRGGTRVSVGGCCLPIPLTLAVALAGGLRLVRRR